MLRHSLTYWRSNVQISPWLCEGWTVVLRLNSVSVLFSVITRTNQSAWMLCERSARWVLDVSLQYIVSSHSWPATAVLGPGETERERHRLTGSETRIPRSSSALLLCCITDFCPTQLSQIISRIFNLLRRFF